MENRSVHHSHMKAETPAAFGLFPGADHADVLHDNGLPTIRSLSHFADISGADYSFLHETVAREREYDNYKMFAVGKRCGGMRYIHAVSDELSAVHKFMNTVILQRVAPHHCSYAFNYAGGIRNCASVHCGARWLLRFDLEDFFYSVNEVDVFNVFMALGYSRLLSFELARLCTTIRLPRRCGRKILRRNSASLRTKFPYRSAKSSRFIGVLPQGAPTSPMLSNLAAYELDEKLEHYAVEKGLTYTRYADDLTFSTQELPKAQSIGCIRSGIVRIIRECGFRENRDKFRIAGPGSRKTVLGLLVDGDVPRISNEMYKRIDRLLHAASKFGFRETAFHEGFDSTPGFRNHLAGLLSYVKDVDEKSWRGFEARFRGVM